MERLTDFLNHGILPFTGRAIEAGRILAFWRGTFEAQELRTALLVGEAGIGKSRLLDEVIPAIADAGGVVIHAKLVPGAAISLLPLLAKGLWYSEVARRLLKAEPEPTCAAIAAALRRMAQLRPTLLVIEHVHLISGDALRELAMLLEAITEETISLLCLARPVELPARAVIHRTMVEEIELAGLEEGEVEKLWRTLFGIELEAGLLRQLHEATGGNPLALRSALRSAIASRSITAEPRPDGAGVTVDAASFGQTLRKSIDLLVQGMAAHLTDEERAAAGRLASLGEMFAPESAALLIPDAAGMVESLTLKGIIAPARTSPTLIGTPSVSPFIFTHALLHHDLVSEARAPVGMLIGVIAGGLPLYSTLPFSLVAGCDLPAPLDADVCVRFIRSSINVSFLLDTGPDWELASEILRAGWWVFDAIRGMIDGELEQRLEADLLQRGLASPRIPDASEEFERNLRRFLALTEPHRSGPMLAYRIRALHYLHLAHARSDYGACLEVWHRVEELIEHAPELAAGEVYLNYLEEVANAAKRVPDPLMLRHVEARLAQLMTSPYLTPSLRTLARQMVAPNFLLLFDTEEELAERLALLSELPKRIDRRNASLEVNRILLLETIGRMREALESARHAAVRFRQIGLPRNAAHAELVALCARAALGADLESIRREALRLASAPGYPSSPMFRRNIGIYLTEIGLLRGELEWTRAIDAELGGGGLDFWPEGNVLVMLGEGSVTRAIEEIPEEEEPQRLLRDLGGLLLEGKDDRSSSEALRSILARPLLRLDDLLLLHAALALIEAAGSAPVRERMLPEIRHAVTAALEWMVERKLLPLISAMIDRGGGYLTKREAGRWRTEARMLAAEYAARTPADTTIRVTMLGSIAFSDGSGELQPLRGLRLRAMLGLLVAARMIREPLSPIEFSMIAAGHEGGDITLAKKTAVMAAVRLREVIGAEAVAAGEPMYVLDLDRVSVDLLEAHHLIQEAREALRRRALMRAYPALRKALQITRGEVPFPGLYDDFFEAIRNDFEHAIRTAVIDVARALLGESDPTSAAELLALAHEGMPEDGEIVELLEQTLAADGRQTEAERLRLRSFELLDLVERF